MDLRDTQSIYKLYTATSSGNTVGNAAKFDCRYAGSRGIFKLPMSFGSKDHIIEAFYYQLSKLTHSEVVESNVIRTRHGIGAFSKFELRPGSKLTHAKDILHTEEVFATQLAKWSIAQLNWERISTDILLLIETDFLLGQADRHCLNFGFIGSANTLRLYKLYDNGLALCSYMGEDQAEFVLSSGDIFSRMGSPDEYIEAIQLLHSTGIRSKLSLSNLSKRNIAMAFRKADSFNELTPRRLELMLEFIHKRALILKELR